MRTKWPTYQDVIGLLSGCYPHSFIRNNDFKFASLLEHVYNEGLTHGKLEQGMVTFYNHQTLPTHLSLTVNNSKGSSGIQEANKL